MREVILGDEPIEEFDEDVKELVADAELLAARLEERGWQFDREYSGDNALTWFFPPSEFKPERRDDIVWERHTSFILSFFGDIESPGGLQH